MFSRKTWLAPISLTVAICASAGLDAQTPKIPAAAKQIAQAMQLRESTKTGAELSLQKAVEQGRVSQAELDCTKASNLDFAVDAYAAAIAAALSSSELKQANSFFSGAAGRAYAHYARSVELRQRGIPDPDPKLELTPAETAAATKFLATNAGRKLLRDRVMETPQLKASLAQGFVALKARCAG
jgi:hypothetical protein